MSYHPNPHGYHLGVRGDSMKPRFPDGCLLWVEPCTNPEPGKFVIAQLGGKEDAPLTFRQLVTKDGERWLMPLNQSYPATRLTADAHITGVVKGRIVWEDDEENKREAEAYRASAEFKEVIAAIDAAKAEGRAA